MTNRPLTKEAIVRALVQKSNLFFVDLGQSARNWFVRRIVDRLLKDGVGLTQLEVKTTDKLRQTKVAALKMFTPKTGTESAKERFRLFMTNHWRAEAVYGIVGTDLSLLDEPNRLKTLARRRARTAARMHIDVGNWPDPRNRPRTLRKKPSNDSLDPDRLIFIDNYSRAFEYPITIDPLPVEPPELWVPPDEDKISDAARPYWRRGLYGSWILTAVGKNNPRVAVESLFYESPDYIARNWLYCQQVVMILHMDALAEVKDATSLYLLMSTINDHYLRIDNPRESGGGPYVTTDKDPARQYFHQDPVDIDTLHVGDHVAFNNHPAYAELTTVGVWAGEHTFVVQGTGEDVRIQGHGTDPLTINEMRAHLVRAFNNELEGAQAVVRNHWESDKEPDSTAKTRNSNGNTKSLGYGGYSDNLVCDENKEGIACWYVQAGTEKFYLFEESGQPAELKHLELPDSVLLGVGGLSPLTVWVVRPK